MRRGHPKAAIWPTHGTPGVENTFVAKNKSGNTHVYGVTLETDGPGVVYDCIQLIGTLGSRYLNFDEQHLKTQARTHQPAVFCLRLNATT